MATNPSKEFGTRKPAPVPPRPPTKRSAEIVLILMGTLAVGVTAYSLMPSEDCVRSPNDPAPSLLQSNNAECRQRGSSSSSSHGSSGGSRYSGSDSSSSHSASGASDSGSNHVSRGGFGSFAHAFGFSGG
ncbi:hypothetical protein OZ411_11840 [Bradyrhizobium sp. Arg237L]|nr:hypothetical protein [Bradyrhizobium sp. Arg237L]MDI4233506.1 hypothetical protein [Bradyrhizobium sp. Arg237L]